MIFQLFIVQLIVFVILIVMLKVLFYKHLDVALKRLNSLYQENLVIERKVKKQLKDSEEQKQIEIDSGRTEAKRIIEEAQKKIQQMQVDAAEVAKRQAEQIIQSGREEVERHRRDLTAEVETQALKLSCQMIKYIFTSEGKETLQEVVFSEALNELEKLEKSKFTVKAKEILIKSAYDLNDKQKELLKRTLSKKIGANINLKTQIDSQLIAGFIIQIGAFIIDGSLENKMRKSLTYLQKM